MIRVVLVDDQTLVREGLASLLALAGDIEVAAQASNGEEALRLISQHRPDVVLLDMRMPGMSGLEVLQALKNSGSLFPTLILTTFDDDVLLLQGIRCGARGYLLKDVTLEQLTDAIRRLAAGETYLQPAVTSRVLKGLEKIRGHYDGFDKADPLTERETEVLRLMAGGYSNREIADAIHLSEGTVKNHISNILSKMGVRDRTRAVLKGLSEGLIG
jgi:DNA-binding NarL/FixJ family response regulator